MCVNYRLKYIAVLPKICEPTLHPLTLWLLFIKCIMGTSQTESDCLL